MFDIGATELLLVGMVALLVIGPRDLPLAMRTAGNWIGKLRGMTKHFRIGIDAMIREAEVEEQEKFWAEKNAKIMREHPDGELESEGAALDKPVEPVAPSTEVAAPPPRSSAPAAPGSDSDEPELSLPPPSDEANGDRTKGRSR